MFVVASIEDQFFLIIMDLPIRSLNIRLELFVQLISFSALFSDMLEFHDFYPLSLSLCWLNEFWAQFFASFVLF